jgi:fumarate hydratase subunit beta
MTVYKLRTPISETEIRKLRVNDIIYLTGILVTARDAAHKRALEFNRKGKKLPIDLEGLAIFHCGPIVKKINDDWILVAAGPTTSTRMDLYEDQFIKNFKTRLIIGKGGMGRKTSEGMKKFGAVYGAFTGGAAVLAARAVKKIKKVEWLDLGMPEALWIFNVENFGPITVAIDSYGRNLFEDSRRRVLENKKKIYNKLGIMMH